MKILVTGCTGQVGTELMKQGPDVGFEMFGFTSSELDITQQKGIEEVFAELKPDLVINAAAYTAVDKAESEPEKAYAVNEHGPKLLAIACNAADIPLFHISTDYVFDGTLDRPYTEEDEPNPQSVYGRSKLMGELAIKEHLEKHIILRTSWVFSETGNNFVKTMVRLAKDRDHLTVVDDQYGGPTSARGIALVLLEIAAQYLREGEVVWGTYNFSQSPYVSWYQFAQAIIKRATGIGLVRHSVDVAPIPSSEFPTRVSRPANSRLNTNALRLAYDVEDTDWASELDRIIKL